MKRPQSLVASLIVASTPLFFASPGAVHAAPMTATSHTARIARTVVLDGISSAPAWVQQGDPYVHVVDYVANVDPSISQHLSQQVVALVQDAVARYNALPLAVRHPAAQAIRTVSPNLLPGGGGCTPQARVQQQWWGQTVQVNECIVQNIEAADATVAYIASVIALGCTLAGQPECAAPAAAAAGVAIAQKNYVDAQDKACGQRGVFINLPRVGPPWIDKIC